MLCKYKGNVNETMQIKASFSEDGRHIIAGSENGSLYVWETNAAVTTTVSLSGIKRDRNAAYESIAVTTATPAIATVALFTPSAAVEASLTDAKTIMLYDEDEFAAASFLAADYTGKIQFWQRAPRLYWS
jgi:WD40 repeat protein